MCNSSAGKWRNLLLFLTSWVMLRSQTWTHRTLRVIVASSPPRSGTYLKSWIQFGWKWTNWVTKMLWLFQKKSGCVTRGYSMCFLVFGSKSTGWSSLFPLNCYKLIQIGSNWWYIPFSNTARHAKLDQSGHLSVLDSTMAIPWQCCGGLEGTPKSSTIRP